MSDHTRLYTRRSSPYWQGEYYEDGVRRQRSTQRTDQIAARAVLRQWERDASDPAGARARTATLGEELDGLADAADGEVLAGSKSEATVAFYEAKAAQLLRVLTRERLLVTIESPVIDTYIEQRRIEGASSHTIQKELVVLRQALKRAKRQHRWRGDLAEVFPVKFPTGYRPKSRWLPFAEVEQLISCLKPRRGAYVAFSVAVGADPSALGRAQRDDIATDLTWVRVHGTKSDRRERTVQITSREQRLLLTFVLEHADGTGGKLFSRWTNVGRDLHAACDRLGIVRCCPNDLRRTFGHWLRAAGHVPHLIGAWMGHQDGRMAELVYARLEPAELRALIEKADEKSAHQAALSLGLRRGVEREP